VQLPVKQVPVGQQVFKVPFMQHCGDPGSLHWNPASSQLMADATWILLNKQATASIVNSGFTYFCICFIWLFCVLTNVCLVFLFVSREFYMANPAKIALLHTGMLEASIHWSAQLSGLALDCFAFHCGWWSRVESKVKHRRQRAAWQWSQRNAARRP
jgi:hypothetical protein